MQGAFAKKDLDSPRLSAELLLSHVIGCERLRLYMDADRPATALERENLRELVGRALSHEPVQYLVGKAFFFGLPFKVDQRVLIPRPATETIVEHVLQHARATPGFGGASGDGLLIADVCTGSGCIAIALAKHLPGARVVAPDISPEALDLARENALVHGVADRIEFLKGDLFAPLLEHPVTRARNSLHYLVSNPPYIPDHEWAACAPNVRDHEPHIALRGGPDGLDCVRRVIEGGPTLIRPGGLMLVEVADSTAPAALDLMQAQPAMAEAEILKDFEGLPRVIRARKAS
jgi:release factor glutamine methyltransferase